MAKRKGQMPPAATGTIALVTVAPQLGQDCVFNVTTSGLKGNQNPRVQLIARQNGVVVYGEARDLDPDGTTCTFPPLGGGSSDWLNDTPPADAHAPATCEALLYYWDFHPQQVQVPLAAPVAFNAAGL
jgi:hypothetical protein